MADKGAPSGVGSALVLILLLTGIAIWQWPLESLRPPASNATPVDRIAALQDIPARLWQDPFVATRSDKAPRPGPGAARRPAGVAEIVSEYLKAQRSGSALEVEILAVMVNGGRSADDAENRLRTRYAVVAGILESDYSPDDPENLGLALVQLPAASPQKTFSMPFEWYSCSPSGDAQEREADPRAAPSCDSAQKRLLVVWINASVLDQTGKPLANLLGLFPAPGGARPKRVTVLGPTNSDTLAKYAEEAGHAGPGLAAAAGGVRMLSPSATVADEGVLGVVYGADGVQDESLAGFFGRTIGLSFVRMVGPDENLVQSLVKELGLRGLSPPLCLLPDWRCDSPNTVLVIYEADSLYARNLLGRFRETLDARCDTLGGAELARCTALQRDRLLSFEYLRGLDGEAGPGEGDAGGKGSEGGDPRSKSSAKERPYGASQYDYLRRMSRSILDLQASLLSEGEKRAKESGADAPGYARMHSWMQPRIRAVGVIGSDTFDKLLILQAVKPLLPEATFFTVDLDARFLEPDQYSWTRNLLIASNFGLTLDPKLQTRTPPFRDTYQTGAFLATRLALACPKLNMPESLLARPRLYEVGRGEAVDLSPFEDTREAVSKTDCPIFDADKNPSLHRERSDREDFHVGAGGFLKALVVCTLAFLLFSTFFTTTRSTAPLTDFAWFAGVILAGVVVYELFYHLVIASDDEEPWRFLGGVSAWPSQIVLVATIGYCVWAVGRIRKSIEKSNGKLGEDFFSVPAEDLEKTNPGIVAHCGKLMRPIWQNSDSATYSALWRQYLRHGNLTWSMARAVGASALFLAAWIALTLNHPPVVPLRGQLSYFLDFVVSKTALFALMWLAFFVADQVRLCIGFFRYFLDGHTDWPVETLQRFGQSAAAGDTRLLSDYVDIRLLAERSKVVGDTVYYPFFALVFFVAARVEFFDAWTWPLALALLVGACFVVMVLAFLMLRLTAYRAREGAIRRLNRAVLQLLGEGAEKKDLAEQVQHALDHVKNCTEGAFRPMSEEPVLRALIIPTGGLSGLGVLQYFYVQRF